MATINPLIRTLADNQPSEILLQCCYHYEERGVLKDVIITETLLHLFKQVNPALQFTKKAKKMTQKRIHQPFFLQLIREDIQTFQHHLDRLFTAHNLRDLKIALKVVVIKEPQSGTEGEEFFHTFLKALRILTPGKEPKSSDEVIKLGFLYYPVLSTIYLWEKGVARTQAAFQLMDPAVAVELLYDLISVPHENQFNERRNDFFLNLCPDEKKSDLLSRLLNRATLLNQEALYHWTLSKENLYSSHLQLTTQQDSSIR